MTITDKVVPNLVGVDIGCGVDIHEFTGDLDFEKLDKVIRAYVPSGNSVRNKAHRLLASLVDDLNKLTIDLTSRELNRINLSLGTLGGGNHFIEVNVTEDNRKFLSIHSGSRSLGVKVAKYHQDLATKYNDGRDQKLEALIEKLKYEGKHGEIQARIKAFKDEYPSIPKELTYLEDKQLENYLHDMRITQKFAEFNRDAMVMEIMREMGWKQQGVIKSTHNYIDFGDMVLRKGAISAHANQDIVIPINMRDGSIIARGKGNADWNNSAPHGAGRVLSRTKAKSQLDLELVKQQMEGIFTTSLDQSTLDEAPDAYKPLDEIIKNTTDTIEIIEVVKPIYNFKASE